MGMKIEIVDNFLPEVQWKAIDSVVSGSNIPWYFVDNLNEGSYLGNYYFSHQLVEEQKVIGPHPNQLVPIFRPVTDRLGIDFSRNYRIKLNMYPRTQRRVHHSVHRDYDTGDGMATLLYFVNDNDGVTVFDGKRKIRSKANRAALFDGSNKHHSTTPTNANYRCTINFDYML